MSPADRTIDWAKAAKENIEAAFQTDEPALVLIERERVAAPRNRFLSGLADVPLRALPGMLASDSSALLMAALHAHPLPSGAATPYMSGMSRWQSPGIRAQADWAGGMTHLTVGYGQEHDGAFRLEMRLQRPTIEAGIRARALAGQFGSGAHSIGVLREVVAHAAVFPASLNNNPLTLGSSVGTRGGAAGTLGGFVRDASGRIALLSCSHVLAQAGLGPPGEIVFHPAPGDAKQPNSVGLLDRFEDLRPAGARPWDIATALIDPIAYRGSNMVPSGHGFTKQGQPLAGVKRGSLPAFPKVTKIGRRSGETFGHVVGENLSVQVWFDALNGEAEVADLIEIAWDTPDHPFSQAGDSGSLVYLADTLEPLGLVIAGGIIEMGGTQAGRSYACRLAPVLDAWQLTLV